MQVVTQNGLDGLEELPPDPQYVDALRKSGFRRMLDSVASRDRELLRRLTNRFRLFTDEEHEALLFEATSISEPHHMFVAPDGVPMQVAAEAIAAKQLKMTELLVRTIVRQAGQIEYALIGKISISDQEHSFLIARWGDHIDDLATLANRRSVTLFRQENARQAAAAEQTLIAERESRREKRTDIAWGVGTLLVGVAAIIIVAYLVAPFASGFVEMILGQSVAHPTLPYNGSLTEPIIGDTLRLTVRLLQPVGVFVLSLMLGLSVIQMFRARTIGQAIRRSIYCAFMVLVCVYVIVS